METKKNTATVVEEEKAEKATPATPAGAASMIVESYSDIPTEALGAEEVTEPEEVAAEKTVYLRIRREQFKGKDGKTMFWGYFVYGKMLGKEVRATVKPLDMRGYELLDLFFNTYRTASLGEVPYQTTDERTGQTRSGVTYAAMVGDGEGELISVKVVPAKSSDKAVIEYFFRKAKATRDRK